MDAWWLTTAGVMVLAAIVFGCQVCLRREQEEMDRLWGVVCSRLRERCELLRRLSRHMRELVEAPPKLVDDIDYLLEGVHGSDDPHTHAGVHNGLVLTVQRAIEEFHHSDVFRGDKRVSEVMEAISVVDSRLAPLRDRFNEFAERYDRRLRALPFSIAARLMRAEPRARFPMLIPWWSTHETAYGGVSAKDIKHYLETWKAPMIVAPSQLARRARDPGTKGEAKDRRPGVRGPSADE